MRRNSHIRLFPILRDTRGVLGEYVLMGYRFFLIALVAFVVLGVSTFAYSYDVVIRDVEARLVARDVVFCLLSDESLGVGDDVRYSLLSYCGLSGDVGKFYVKVVVHDFGGEDIVLQQGDSGAVWVREIAARVEEYDLYNPGYFEDLYELYLRDEDGIGTMYDVDVVVVAHV